MSMDAVATPFTLHGPAHVTAIQLSCLLLLCAVPESSTTATPPAHRKRSASVAGLEACQDHDICLTRAKPAMVFQ